MQTRAKKAKTEKKKDKEDKSEEAEDENEELKEEHKEGSKVQKERSKEGDTGLDVTTENAGDNTAKEEAKMEENIQDAELLKILGFDPSTLATREDFGSAFKTIASVLMNDYTLEVNNKSHRLAELEFYFFGDKHLDIFTHQDELQKTCGNWYFHRAGKSYKGGSYKGLDITFGTDKIFAGILIRAIVDVESDEYIEGPCNVVNKILELNSTKKAALEIVDLVKKDKFNLSVVKPGLLYLKPNNTQEKKEVYSSFRVGLTLKKTDGERSFFIMKPYRYVSCPKEVRKGRPNLVLGLHGEGKTVDEIHKLTGVAKATVKKYVDLCEGASGDWKSYEGKALNTDDLCKLYKILR